MIEISSLSMSRDDVQILRDVSLSVPSGRLAAIIGPNGAGKSTLLHCMAGLLAPDSGQVRVNGQDIHALREQGRALILSLLTQSQGAVPRLSVRDLVAFGRWPHHRGRPTPTDHTATAEAMARFDLDALAQRSVESLSGGQRQRAFVAMAYAQSTPWMFLDEPLAALDPKYVRDIMDRLRAMTGTDTGKRSIALVLHDLSVAARYADFCIAMKAGRIIAAGPWRDIVTSALLSELYETPLRLAELDGAPVVVGL
ncbi:ATP-binding cassette domain-containing protein [Roseinatronobacter alkalisoli]|uniref:ATP-binding cassette domain-containing protein n=1 Tax=Roseinatronobacter alkalisoli TaxID=3028235 RepID=A0ABT5TD61_9RHOB|nr:ATP-binding cassette domain-containing protein [Roseinatronobacter sp. HJB301]MDD7973062.1 ATP-binding cassette domain-containing protein [Roseinatronobacter sp. HJB301]